MTTGAGELSRATTLLYPQYLWAQVMGQQMAQQQEEVPLTGPESQGMGPERKEQGGQPGQGEGNPVPSPTPQCPALHHTGTGAARCSQGEGREAVTPLKGLPGTPKGPACQSQQVGGLVTLSACTSDSTVARATRACTGTQGERPGSSLDRGWARVVRLKGAGEGSRTAAPASSRRALPALLEVRTRALGLTAPLQVTVTHMNDGCSS